MFSRPIRAVALTFIATFFCGATGVEACKREDPDCDPPDDPGPYLEDVPSSMLEGDRLVLEKWGCSVEVPGPEWMWLRMAAEDATRAEPVYSANYYAINVFKSVPFGFYVAIDPGGSNPGETYMDLLAEDLQRFPRANQGSIKGFNYASSEMPLPGSQRFTYSTTWADGRKWYGFGYVGGKEKKFVFSAETRSEEEPILLRDLVGSFRLLQERDLGKEERGSQTRRVERAAAEGGAAHP